MSPSLGRTLPNRYMDLGAYCLYHILTESQNHEAGMCPSMLPAQELPSAVHLPVIVAHHFLAMSPRRLSTSIPEPQLSARMMRLVVVVVTLYIVADASPPETERSANTAQHPEYSTSSPMITHDHPRSPLQSSIYPPMHVVYQTEKRRLSDCAAFFQSPCSSAEWSRATLCATAGASLGSCR